MPNDTSSKELCAACLKTIHVWATGLPADNKRASIYEAINALAVSMDMEKLEPSARSAPERDIPTATPAATPAASYTRTAPEHKDHKDRVERGSTEYEKLFPGTRSAQ